MEATACAASPRVRDELDVFVRDVRPRMCRMVRRQGVPEEDAEDLIQQTLMALVGAWSEVRDPEAWVSGALRKKCLMYWRGRRRRIYDAVDGSVLEWLAAPVGPVQERRTLRSELSGVMTRLPARYRWVLRLRFGLGYDPPEVARRLGYRTSSIGKVTSRSLTALGRELTGSGPPRARSEPRPRPSG